MRSKFQCTPATAVRLFAAQLLDEPVAAQARTGHWTDNAKQAFTQHWPEYMIEGLCLGTFMISACAFSALLEHPDSLVRMSLMNGDVRRFLVGVAMGVTAILLIYSPLGQRSGVSNSRKFARYTGIVTGTMVMLFITFEAPLWGMSMNPARSFASDFVGMQWQGLWIYFTAPLIGMLTAAEVFVRTRGLQAVICAKLNHFGNARCIFRCGYMMVPAETATSGN
jgi:glycerol uptake facilitator-like aquaporin